MITNNKHKGRRDGEKEGGATTTQMVSSILSNIAIRNFSPNTTARREISAFNFYL